MKVSNRLIAGLGVLVLSASALVQAAPPDQRGGDDNGPGQHQDHGQQAGPQGAHGNGNGNNNGNGNDHRNEPRADSRGNNQRGGRPPADFGDVRRTISEHREIIGRGQPLPPRLWPPTGPTLPAIPAPVRWLRMAPSGPGRRADCDRQRDRLRNPEWRAELRAFRNSAHSRDVGWTLIL
jgi:hypothetical protein